MVCSISFAEQSTNTSEVPFTASVYLPIAIVAGPQLINLATRRNRRENLFYRQETHFGQFIPDIAADLMHNRRFSVSAKTPTNCEMNACYELSGQLS